MIKKLFLLCMIMLHMTSTAWDPEGDIIETQQRYHYAHESSAIPRIEKCNRLIAQYYKDWTINTATLPRYSATETVLLRPLDFLLLYNSAPKIVFCWLLEQGAKTNLISTEGYSTAHYLAYGLFKTKRKMTEDDDAILANLVQGGCNINHHYRKRKHASRVRSTGFTPLSMYLVHQKGERKAFAAIKSFFRQGARIFSSSEKGDCNLLHIIVRNHADNPEYATRLISFILSEKAHLIEEVRKPCELYCLLFHRLNKGKTSYQKFPRVLRDFIINLVVPDFKTKILNGIDDIKDSLFDKGIWGQTLFERIKETKGLEKSADLHAIVNPTFWNRSFREVIPELEKHVAQILQEKK